MRSLFDDLGAEPSVAYPSLTQDELVSLGDRPLLEDDDSLAWWASLEPGTREQVLATAQRGLLARGLVTADPGDPSVLSVVRRVRMILALRRLPAFVTLAGSASAAPTLRCYGVAGPASEAAVLIEARVVPGVGEYRLCTPNYAAGVVARFLLAAPDPVLDPAGPAPSSVLRRLELFPPGQLTGGRRYVVVVEGPSTALAPVDEAGRAGVPAEVTEESLAGLITARWADDAEAVARLTASA